MSVAISRAIETVFPEKPDFICHYHFLSDIGSDLLEDDYALIRKRLKKQGVTAKLRRWGRKLKEQLDDHPEIMERVTPEMDHPNRCEPKELERLPLLSSYMLIQWIFDGKNQGHGYGFLFDRVHGVFTQRLYDAYTQIQAFKEVCLRDQWRDNKPLWKRSAQISSYVRPLTTFKSKPKSLTGSAMPCESHRKIPINYMIKK